MKRYLSFLFLVGLFFLVSIFSQKSFAQNATEEAVCPTTSGYLVTPSKEVGPCNMVDESIPTVSLSFTDLPDLSDTGQNYYYCLKSYAKDCSEDNWKQISAKDGSINFPTLCGDGKNALKSKCKTDGADWFYPETTYRAHLAKGESKKLSSSDIVATGAFYVYHFYPKVVDPPFKYPIDPKQTIISSQLNLSALKGGGAIDVTLQGRDPKGRGESDTYNDYWIQVISRDSDYKTAGQCLFIPSSGNNDTAQGKTSVKLPPVITGEDGVRQNLTAGNYVLRIKDGKGGNGNAANPVCHEASFTYYDIPFTIEDNSPGTIGPLVKDPYNKESTKQAEATPAPPVCPTGAQNKQGYCTSIRTALGTIHTDPKLFLGDLFRIVLSIGGIVAIAFFIQAGYILMTSAGNKERVGQAREQITAAILGLIFIILSFAILEFIGVDILHIPGLTR